MSLDTIIRLSNEYGSNPELVLAGGGNTSYKDDTTLYVKSSGHSLSTIKAEGFVKMDLKALTSMLLRVYPADETAAEAAVLADMMAARLPGEESKRPSVEALLHALFPQRLVVHLHPAIVNGVTCSNQGGEAVRRILGDRIVWINEIKPGYTLARYAKQAMDTFVQTTGHPADLLVMQNHGIFFAADTEQDIRTLVADVLKKLDTACAVKPDVSPADFDRRAVCELAPKIRMMLLEESSSFVTFRANPAVLELCSSRDAFAPLNGAFTPDHIVYTKYLPCYCDDADAVGDAVQDYRAKTGELPKIVAVRGLGIFACGRTKKDADTAADVFLDAVKIAFYCQNFGGHRFMSPELVSFIRSWEVESYRKKVSGGALSEKRLQGKISIVTGGAQGFGAGLAHYMCAEGACVVIADLNEQGARQTAEELCREFGAGAATHAACDVTDESSVEDMIRTAVLCYGGLDLLVSNAGIVKSGGLEEMDLRSFELVTRVNYTAFFLCSKYASHVMRIQNAVRPDFMTDIIQINSKSGLEGSNRNFAYAGSKFGGIGLVESFALELVENGIKVNAICPGNFLNGPLWSDPEKGLFVQYLRSGKVPGAKTVDDVRRAYEAKVPMRRGCEVVDVARALFYVVEQKYETGQAVPVTGGQNMLK